MKAACYSRYGPPEVLEVKDVPAPSPGGDEVLVRVRASTVCAPDWRLRGAKLVFTRMATGLSAPRPNFIPGLELAGEIAAVGENVTRFRIGDRVFGSSGFKFGACAEYVALLPDRRLEAMPANASYEEAAAIPFGAISALSFLRRANIEPGQRVLIYGASSSVGTAAVQLAKHFGAHVTGVCSGANVEIIRSIGADEVIDYTRDDFAKSGAKSGRSYDVILDAVGKSGYSRSLSVLRRGGYYLLVMGMPSALVRAPFTRRAKVIWGMANMGEGDLALMKRLVEEGAYKPVIGRRFTLDEIREAHLYAESGRKVGAAVVTID